MEIRLLKLNEIDEAYVLFNKYSDEVGFVRKITIRESIEKGTLIGAFLDKLVGVCNFNKRKKDNTLVIYEIAVDEDYRGKGIARQMIMSLLQLSDRIFLKCPVDIDSNYFYQKMGFKLAGVEKGSKRKLFKWYLTK
jgi:GNAT superfamily N-acetyltransferase